MVQVKCSKARHIFEGESRKCICGKADKWYFVCSRCNEANVSRIMGSICEACQEDPAYLKELADFEKNRKTKGNNIKHYREPVAFGHDRETGKPMAIDKKGRFFDPSETRYNTKTDPHGWKATDKIPKKKTIII
jgi:hypothetical protein